MNQQTFGNLIKLTRIGLVNSYFVKEDDGLTVIDTNLAGSAKGIAKAAEALGAPIRRILLTHSHYDHVASVDGLHALIPDAEVIIGERESAFLKGDMTLRSGEPTAKLRGGYMKFKTEPTRLVNDGDMIGSLKVIAAPGHTPGHIALLDTRDNSLIAGDAFTTLFGAAVSGKVKWLFPFPAWATWHKPTALETAKKLRALNPSLLAVGHGKVLTDPLAEMDQAIATAEREF
jgi:glyoxylase-like metal-dependent hydrolase (beta-lactamase superfamily II)